MISKILKAHDKERKRLGITTITVWQMAKAGESYVKKKMTRVYGPRY